MKTETSNTKNTDSYQGWTNRATWNVALYINNSYSLYTRAVKFMSKYKGRAPYADFIKSIGLEHSRTSDNFKYLSNSLNYRELNEMMRELIS